jgi:hypothetical protein
MNARYVHLLTYDGVTFAIAVASRRVLQLSRPDLCGFSDILGIVKETANMTVQGNGG